jgi:hypothetical protein
MNQIAKVEHQGQRVLTTKQLAEFYEQLDSIRDRYSNYLRKVFNEYEKGPKLANSN